MSSVDPRQGYDEVLRRVLAVFPNALKVVLFGSRARGVARPDSDIDLLIVAATDLRPAWRSGKVLLALRDLRQDFDVLVYTPEEYERSRRFPGGVVQEIERTGQVLHAA